MGGGVGCVLLFVRPCRKGFDLLPEIIRQVTAARPEAEFVVQIHTWHPNDPLTAEVAALARRHRLRRLLRAGHPRLWCDRHDVCEHGDRNRCRYVTWWSDRRTTRCRNRYVGRCGRIGSGASAMPWRNAPKEPAHSRARKSAFLMQPILACGSACCPPLRRQANCGRKTV